MGITHGGGPPATLVGRDEPIARLETMLSSAASGRGRTAALVGPPGVGKSALTRAFAASTDVVVLTGRCGPAPSPPLRALSELALSAVAADADVAPVDDTIFGAAVRTLLGAPFEHDDAEHHVLMIGEGLRRLVTAIDRRPVLCVVEDLQWADEETLVALDYLVDHISDSSVMLLVNARAHQSEAADRLLVEWERRGGFECLPVEPLERPAAEELARDLAADRVPDAHIEAIVDASEGSPLLIEAFVGDALDNPADVDALTVPSTFRAAVERKLAQLPEDTRSHVQFAALLGRSIEPSALRLFGLSDEQATATIAAALQAQIALAPTVGRPARFQHALTREAVAESLDDESRRRLASSGLAGVATDDLDADGLAAASRLASSAGDDRRAAELLIEAARRAVGVGATATALARLDAAAGLSEADALHGPQLRALRVEALALAGRATEALAAGEHVLAELRATGDGATSARLALALARASGTLADWDAALRWLGDDGDQRVVAEVESLRAVANVELGRVADARALALGVLERTDRHGVAECEAHEVLGRAVREHSYREAADHFRSAVEAAASAGLPLWRARALLELGLCEATSYGRPETFEEASRSARRVGALGLSAMCDYNLANLYGIHVRPAEGRAVAERAIATAQQLGSPMLEALGWLTLGQVHAGAGSAGKARYAGDRARAVAPDEPEVEGLASGMCDGWSAAVVGDLAGAAGHYAHSLQVLDDLPVPTATAAWYHGPVVLAAVDHPVTERVRARLATPPFRAVPGLAVVSSIVEMIVVGRTDGPDAAAAAEARVEARLGEHPELASRVEPFFAITRGIAATAALRHGWGDPIDQLERSEQCCRLRGLDAAARAFASLLRDAGVAPRTRGRSRTAVPDALAPYGLTSREVDVLALVGERLTNREVASRLAVSSSTVKTHVERLLAKTGRSNRAELADLFEATVDEER